MWFPSNASIGPDGVLIISEFPKITPATLLVVNFRHLYRQRAVIIFPIAIWLEKWFSVGFGAVHHAHYWMEPIWVVMLCFTYPYMDTCICLVHLNWLYALILIICLYSSLHSLPEIFPCNDGRPREENISTSIMPFSLPSSSYFWFFETVFSVDINSYIILTFNMTAVFSSLLWWQNKFSYS